MEQTELSAPIEITERAFGKVVELAVRSARPNAVLRVYIEGGGCSGFQYGFAFEDAPEEDDEVLVSGDASVIVDPMSLQYLSGARLDYLEDLAGSRFVLSNPNARTTCGCGASFSI